MNTVGPAKKMNAMRHKASPMLILESKRIPREIPETAEAMKAAVSTEIIRNRPALPIFPMPVIGIPMSGKNLEGVDALYSIVQMPPGIPVATVAIDGGANAAILAAKILATSDPELLERLKAYTKEMKETVQAKAAKLDELGHKEYLKQM